MTAARRVAVRSSELLANHFVIFGMSADPKPQKAVRNFNRQRSIIKTDAHRTVFSDLFEMKRRVVRISLKELEVLIGQLPDCGRKNPIAAPK